MSDCENTIEFNTRSGTEEIHVLVNGIGPHATLVWHGFDSANRFYHWNYFLKHGRLIRAGLPGHGPVRERRWAQCKDWTSQGFAEIAAAVCKHYYAGTPLTLVGHSTGALMALGAAALVPRLVGRLVLINPLIWSPVGAPIRLLAKSRAPWRWMATFALAPGIRRKRSSIDSYLEGLRPIVRDTEGFYGNPNTVAYTQTGHDDYRRSSIAAIIGTARLCCTLDLRETLRAARLDVSSLIVHGEEDPVSAIEQSRWLAEHLAKTTLVTLPGVGHLCFAEREHAFGQLVTDWLDEQISAGLSCAES